MENTHKCCGEGGKIRHPAGGKEKGRRMPPSGVKWRGREDPSFRKVEYLHDNYLKITFGDGTVVEMDMYPAFLTVIEMMRCSECGAHLLRLLEPESFLDFTYDSKFIHWDSNRFSISALMLYPLCLEIKSGCYGEQFGK